MDYNYYSQNAQLHFQDVEMYAIKLDKQIYQQGYDRLIEQMDQILPQDQQKDKIIALINKFIEDISKQLKQIGQNIVKNILMFKMKVKQKQQQIITNHETIQSLNQTNDILQVKIQHWQRQFQNLKLQNIQITQKYEKRLKQIKKQKKQIKQTFRIVQQNTQIERMLLQNLQLQKQQINQLILSQKSIKFLYFLEQKKQLFDQLTELKQKNEQNGLKLRAANNKIIWQDKQIKILNQQIKQKDDKFKQLQRQIYQFNKNKQQQQDNQLINKQQKQKLTNFIFNNNNNQDKNQQQTNRRVSFIQINPLSDQIMGFQDYQMRKSFISIARSDGKSPNDYDPINKSVINQQQEEDASKIKSKFLQKYRPTQINIPNFYFAHYLLTCQSVKLKINQEKYFCLDMSIYYKEILDSKIPFHMWDQWIIKKLKQIANNQ